MAKNELRHVDFFLIVYDDWYTLPVVPNSNAAPIRIDSNLDHRHLLVTMKVISRIDNYLI